MVVKNLNAGQYQREGKGPVLQKERLGKVLGGKCLLEKRRRGREPDRH